jgi:hypothetical protein
MPVGGFILKITWQPPVFFGRDAPLGPSGGTGKLTDAVFEVVLGGGQIAPGNHFPVLICL